MEYGYFNKNGTDTNCSGDTFTEKQRGKILIAMGATASVSFLMCLITVVCVVLLKLYKYFTFRLASYQVLSSMLFSSGMIVQVLLTNYSGGNFDRFICELAGLMIEYFMWVKLLFTVCLIFHLFFVGVFMRHLVKLERLYIMVSVLFPFLFVWVPFIHHSYGIAGAWCWIRDWKDDCAGKKYVEGIIEQFVLWYGPVFLTLTVSIAVVVLILVITAQRAYSKSRVNSETERLLHQDNTRHNRKALKQMLPLLAYPAIFYMLVLVPLINRIYNALSSNANYPLALTHSLSIGAWGFFSSWALLIHILLKKKDRELESAYLEVQIPCSSASTIQTGSLEDQVNMD